MIANYEQVGKVNNNTVYLLLLNENKQYWGCDEA